MATPPTFSLEDIAKLWHTNRRRARDVIVKTPGFPPRAPGSTNRKPVWGSEQILNYLRGGSTGGQA